MSRQLSCTSSCSNSELFGISDRTPITYSLFKSQFPNRWSKWVPFRHKSEYVRERKAGIQQSAGFGDREHNGQLRRSLQWKAARIRSELGGTGTSKGTFCKIIAKFRAGERAINNVTIQVWLLCVAFVLLLSAPYKPRESLVPPEERGMILNVHWKCIGQEMGTLFFMYFSW